MCRKYQILGLELPIDILNFSFLCPQMICAPRDTFKWIIVHTTSLKNKPELSLYLRLLGFTKALLYNAVISTLMHSCKSIIEQLTAKETAFSRKQHYHCSTFGFHPAALREDSQSRGW